MASENSKALITVTSLVMTGLFVFYGWKIHEAYLGKTKQQMEVVEGLNRWSQQYLAMEEVKKQWEASFEPESKVEHISGLYDMIGFGRYGLENDKDSISLSGLTQIMQETQKDKPLGLTKICMSNSSLDSSAVIVAAKSYKELLDGVDKLSKRPDILIDSVTLQGDKQVPIARLGGFCILLRS